MKKKKSLCTFIIALILILSVFSGLSLNPVTISAASYPAVYVDPASATGSSGYLYVDAFNEDTGWNGWTRTGASPWLDADDVNIINSNNQDGIGNFTFSDLTTPGTPISVSLDVLVYDGTGADVIQAEIWDGSSWTSHIFTPGSVWDWLTWDVTAILDTSEKVDGAEVRFTHVDPGGPRQDVYIDAARLDFVGGAPGPGGTYTIDIMTNYTGSDITSYQFDLTYNPDTLHITSVENGPVVVYGTLDYDYMFSVGPIDNILGTLGVTGALIFNPANTVSGPGVLANVTFQVVGTGNSSITLGSVQLNAWNGTAYEFIVDGATMPDHIGHGYFENGEGGDVAVTNVAPETNSVYKPPGSTNTTNINVTVANNGLSNMTFSVVLYYNSSWTEIGTQTVINLTSGAQMNVTFNWNVTDVDNGNHTLKAVRIHSHLNHNGTADTISANDVGYSWVLVSAVKYPAVYLEPSSIVDPNLTPGNTFIVSVKTDYLGSDITSYQFDLTYNPDTLHITSVENGPVVVYGTLDYDYMFSVGPIDNILGTLGVTGALIFNPTNTVSGPGTLATVTFQVVGTGNSSITLGSVQLNAWNGTAYEFIVDGATMPDHIGHGYFENGGGGDVAVTNVTRIPPPAGQYYVYIELESWEMININVTVANNGLSNMTFSVVLYYNYSLAPGWTEIGTQTVIDLTSGAEANVTFSLNVTTINAPISGYGNYTLKAVRIHSHLNHNGTADTISANDVGYSWVSVRLPGDTNDDIIVDIFDIATISAHWSGPPAGPLGYDETADLNHDESIDISDMNICSAHYGDTLSY